MSLRGQVIWTAGKPLSLVNVTPAENPLGSDVGPERVRRLSRGRDVCLADAAAASRLHCESHTRDNSHRPEHREPSNHRRPWALGSGLDYHEWCQWSPSRLTDKRGPLDRRPSEYQSALLYESACSHSSMDFFTLTIPVSFHSLNGKESEDVQFRFRQYVTRAAPAVQSRF